MSAGKQVAPPRIISQLKLLVELKYAGILCVILLDIENKNLMNRMVQSAKPS